MEPGGGMLGVVIAVALAGLRHGFDIDHIAAITDITSAGTSRKRSFYLATMYATGHAFVLLPLGVAAVVWGRSIPAGLDSFMGRATGATLVALGLYVVYSLVRFRKDFKIQSRWMLVLAGVRRTLGWIQRKNLEAVVIEHAHEHAAEGHHHDGHPDELRIGPAVPERGLAVATRTHAHTHRHVVTAPADPFTEYGTRTTFLVGMVHGVGAETPSQIILMTTAAGIAGIGGGLVVLAAFVAGLFAGNTVLALCATFGLARSPRMSATYLVLALATSVLSIGVGSAYLLGRAELLPVFLGG